MLLSVELRFLRKVYSITLSGARDQVPLCPRLGAAILAWFPHCTHEGSARGRGVSLLRDRKPGTKTKRNEARKLFTFSMSPAEELPGWGVPYQPHSDKATKTTYNGSVPPIEAAALQATAGSWRLQTGTRRRNSGEAPFAVKKAKKTE